MPNTLAHIAVNGLLSRPLSRSLDRAWILLGAVIPDVAWILQRTLVPALPGISGAELRLYAIPQATLAASLLLCAAFALLAVRRWAAFGVLALGSVLHLLLDAAQTRWGNGVHLFAPFSWELLSFGWFWPEDLTTLVLTATGVLYLAWIAARRRPDPGLRPIDWKAAVLVLALFSAYLTTPFLFRDAVLRADNHSVATLLSGEDRVGKEVALDRVRVFRSDDGYAIGTLGGMLAVDGEAAGGVGTLSVRGRFVTADSLQVLEYHRHWIEFRDRASMLGLFVVAVWWSVGCWRQWRGSGENGA